MQRLDAACKPLHLGPGTPWLFIYLKLQASGSIEVPSQKEKKREKEKKMEKQSDICRHPPYQPLTSVHTHVGECSFIAYIHPE